jgi:hypothetical protein
MCQVAVATGTNVVNIKTYLLASEGLKYLFWGKRRDAGTHVVTETRIFVVRELGETLLGLQ